MYDAVLIGGHSRFLGYQKPAGMYKIATELRKNGFSVQCVDLFAMMDENDLYSILNSVITNHTSMFGINSTLLKDLLGGDFFGISNNKFLTLIEQVKSINPSIKIVIGGAQVQEYELDELTPFKDHIDFCASGQGENSVVAIMNHITKGDDLKVKKLCGLNFVTEKDYPYDHFNQSDIIYQPNDIIFKEESLCIEVARGCVFRCAFCYRDNAGKSFGDMTKMADVLKQELIRNYELFGTTNYYIVDDTINDSMQKVEYLHKVLTSLPFKINFTSFGRLDLIWKNPEMASILKEMGMKGVIFGIETLHQEAGRLMGKGLGEERIKKALQICKHAWKNDVNITANFIAGLPKEPIDSILRTIDWLLSPDCPIDSASIYPLFVSSKRNKSRLDKDNGKKFNCHFSNVNDSEWKHDHLSFSGAVALRKHFENKALKKWPNYFLFNAFSLPRYTNIGITMNESLDAAIKNKSNAHNTPSNLRGVMNYRNDIWRRTINKRKEYINALQNFPH